MGVGYVFQASTGSKKKTKTWYICYRVNGKRYRESSGSDKKGDATALLRIRIAEAQQNKRPEIHRFKFRDLADRLRNEYVANGRRSLRRIEQSLKHLRAFFGDN